MITFYALVIRGVLVCKRGMIQVERLDLSLAELHDTSFVLFVIWQSWVAPLLHRPQWSRETLPTYDHANHMGNPPP
jgi:hypothetical protein